MQNVQKLIWQKMFTNVSASVLTGILQVPLGYIVQNANAWAVCETLIREAVAVAAGDGFAQGIFTQFGITVDDEADGVRDGGFGSTTK